jgi:hypothetical protein
LIDPNFGSQEYEFYNLRFKQFGFDSKSLGWSKNSQQIRFSKISEVIDLESRTCLDIGAGFLDFAMFLKEKAIQPKSYLGIEPFPQFYQTANHRGKSLDNFYCEVVSERWEDFLPQGKFDVVLAIGLLNISNGKNYIILDEFLSKFLACTTEHLLISVLRKSEEVKPVQTKDPVFFYEIEKVIEILDKKCLNYEIFTDYLPHDMLLKISA